MAKITAISVQEKNKKRCNLFLDGEFFSGLSLEIAMQYRLKVGMEIDQMDLADIILSSDKIEALEKAISYTTKSLKTKKQVKTYLNNKGYSFDVVCHCIDKLEEYKLIDDSEYAKRYIESVSKNQGKRMTEYKLMVKGVDKERIENAFENTFIPSKENALNIALKHFKGKEKTKENLAKTYRYLISKGFSYEEANYAIDHLKNEDWYGKNFNYRTNAFGW